VERLPSSDKEFDLHKGLASVPVETILERNAVSIDAPVGEFYPQYGKDLTEVRRVIGRVGLSSTVETRER
jgi:hypothetical protein